MWAWFTWSNIGFRCCSKKKCAGWRGNGISPGEFYEFTWQSGRRRMGYPRSVSFEWPAVMTDPPNPAWAEPVPVAPNPVSIAVPDHELIRVIGSGSGGEVWLARNVLGTHRAVKIVYARAFEQR